MQVRYSNSYGRVVIDDQAIANIAASTAMSSYGVVGLVARSYRDGIYQLLNIENLEKGVKVSRNNDGSVDVSLSLFLQYGVRIAVVGENIIEAVKYNIESSANVVVNKVVLYVQGINK